MKSILFIPGFATDSSIFHHQIEELSEQFVINRYDEERKPFPVAQPKNDIILGWSMGAAKAIRLYLENKDKVKALVLVSGFAKFLKSGDFPYGLPPSHMRNLERKIENDFQKGIEFFYDLLFLNPKSEMRNSKQCLNSNIQILNKDKTINDLESLKKEDLRKDLSKIDIPVMIIHGRHDQIVPFESGEYLHDNIKGPKFEVFENSGHAPFLEEQEKFDTTLRSFVEGII
ncbi:alpha/beta fold hydrolase [Candidatus Saganbacteria bacterium]|nr:alpha/beta fold hydrolase [Candidatus Saganbacteria bacterium]